MPVDNTKDLIDVKKLNIISMSNASSNAAGTRGKYVNCIWTHNNNSNSGSSNSSGLSFVKGFISDGPGTISDGNSGANKGRQGSTDAQGNMNTTKTALAKVLNDVKQCTQNIIGFGKHIQAADKEQKGVAAELNSTLSEMEQNGNGGEPDTTTTTTPTPVQNKPAASNPFGATNGNNGPTLITANTPAEQNKTPDNTTPATSDDNKNEELSSKVDALKAKQANLSRMQAKYSKAIKTTSTQFNSTAKTTVAQIKQNGQASQEGGKAAEGVVKGGQITEKVGVTGGSASTLLTFYTPTAAVGATGMKVSAGVTAAGGAAEAGGNAAKGNYSKALDSANSSVSSADSAVTKANTKAKDAGKKKGA